MKTVTRRRPLQTLVGNLLQDGTKHVQIGAYRCIHVQIGTTILEYVKIKGQKKHVKVFL